MSENTLRQADNQVVIEGLLIEKRIEETEVKGKDAITGELDIETAPNSVHTVRVFSYKQKADGTDNGIFKGLKTVADEYNSVADVGRDEADKVRITAGQLGINEYYAQDGTLRSFPQLSTNFVNRVQASEEFSPRAEFEVEVYIHSIIDEIKADEETGRAKVKAFLPLYGGKVVPFEFVVSDEGAVDYVKDNYEAGNTVKFYGDIVNIKEKKVVTEEVAFGKPKEKVTYNTVREYVITGGSEAYDEDNVKAYDKKTIKKALTEREVYLEELKNKKNEKEAPPKKEEKKGFNTKKDKAPVIDISDDDLPF